MKIINCLILFICCSCTCLAVAENKQIYVEVKAAKVRQAPKIWSQGIADVHYGDKLISKELVSDWYRVVTTDGIEGFVHKTSVTNRRVLLSGEFAEVSDKVDPADIVLAGKGFSKEIEEQYFGDDQSLNYLAVDMLEAVTIDQKDILEFMRDGKLATDD